LNPEEGRMNRTIRQLTIGVGIFAVAMLAYTAPKADHHLEPALGGEVPDFALQDESGVEHRLGQYRGKVVVLEWTNPDCPYVARHYDADTMEKLAQRFDAKGVVWFAVNSTYYNKPEDSRAWKEEQGFEYATLQDAEGKVGRMLGARTTPHMFVIDGKGVLRYSGAIDDDPRGRAESPNNYVDDGVRALLIGSDPDPSHTNAYGCAVKYASR
jgi:peroxiredoxin